jgi:hypothetical protein
MTLFTSLTLILNQLLPAQSAVSNFIQIKEGFSKSQIDTIFAKTKDFPNEFQVDALCFELMKSLKL